MNYTPLYIIVQMFMSRHGMNYTQASHVLGESGSKLRDIVTRQRTPNEDTIIHMLQAIDTYEKQLLSQHIYV